MLLSEADSTILELSFDLEQYIRLPIIQFCDLVKLKYRALEILQITILHRLQNCTNEFGFTRRTKGDVLCVIFL